MAADRVTAGGAIFPRLKALGVTHVFINSGTDFPPIIEGLAAAREAGTSLPEPILVGHEHVAMGMAHGAWLATGALQAVMLHTNVGLANGVIGALNAAQDQVPMILMSGRTPTMEAGRFGARTVPIGWGQEMRDQHGLIRDCVKWDYELRFPEQIEGLLDRAAAIARSTPEGPVYLSLPREVLCEEITPTVAPPAARPVVSAPPCAEIERAAALFAAAARPVIFAQRGAGDAAGWAALDRLAADWAAPVFDWWAVANAIRQDHPLYAGGDPGPWLAEADVALVIDSLAPWSPDLHPVRGDLKVIQLGPDPLMARTPVRMHRADATLAGPTGAGIAALEAALRPFLPESGARITARRDAAEGIARAAQAAAVPDASAGLTKAVVGAVVGKIARERDAVILSELGVPLAPLGLTRQGQWRQEPHAGGLGWSLPAALGMKLVVPERLVICTVGDGSLIFANPVACFQVAEAHGLAPLVIVLNNAGYGIVGDGALGLYPGGAAARANRVPLTDLAPSPDFVAIAAASRASAERVETVDALEGALARAVAATEAGRLALLDIVLAR